MDIIRVTCVKYDHVFANDIEAKLPNFDTLLAASSQKKAALSGTQAPPASVARLTSDVESEGEEQEQDQEPEQEQKQTQSKESESVGASSEPPPADLDLSPRPRRVASQEVLRRIGEGLIQDFGIDSENSDSDYVEENSQ